MLINQSYNYLDMKRRVVKHGPSTLIISLPVKWVKQHGVAPGHELDVIESGKSLLVTTEKQEESGRSIAVDVSNLDRSTIIVYVRSLYRRGYSEIKVMFKKNAVHHFREGKDVNVLSILHEETNRLIGMEIIEQRENYCIIKQISESTEKEFSSILRKVFFQLEAAFEDLITGLKKKDLSEIANMQEKHDTIAKFVSYCVRLLNQGKVEDSENAPQLYHLLVSVDLMADMLKYFSRDVIKNKQSFSPESIKVLEEILQNVRTYSKMQFKFDMSYMWEFQSTRDSVRKSMLSMLAKKQQDLAYVSYLASILEILRIMAETTMCCAEPKSER